MQADSIRKSNMGIIDIPGEQREKGTKSLFKQIGYDNFPNLWKNLAH